VSRPPVAPLALIVAWTLALAALSPSADALLATLPLLLLVASLIAGRYPGEGVIGALGTRFAPRTPRRRRRGPRVRPPAWIGPRVSGPAARARGARAPPLAA
jgi:hypothetical protein